MGWLVHLAVLGILTTSIKAANYILHHMFDTCQAHQMVCSEPASPMPPPPPPHSILSIPSTSFQPLHSRPSAGMSRHEFRHTQLLGRMRCVLLMLLFGAYDMLDNIYHGTECSLSQKINIKKKVIKFTFKKYFYIIKYT